MKKTVGLGVELGVAPDAEMIEINLSQESNAIPGGSRVPISDTLLMDLSRPPPAIRLRPIRAPETLVEVRDRVVLLERDSSVLQTAITDLGLGTLLNAELVDVALNTTNNHVVIIDNLKKLEGTANAEAKEVVQELCTLLGKDIGIVKAAYFLKMGKLPEVGRHYKIKALFVSTDEAIGFRAEASKARRETEVEPWVTSYISNDPTKSTRVRIEILKQIGARLSKEASLAGFTFFVTRYDPKPVLVYKQGVKIIRRLGYLEAIRKFGHMLTSDHLKLARKIAGKQFEGRFFINFGF